MKNLSQYFYNIIPDEIQEKIKSGDIDLSAAIEVANIHQRSVSSGQKPKLDSKLFLPLEKVVYEKGPDTDELLGPDPDPDPDPDQKYVNLNVGETPFKKIMAPVAKPLLTVQDLVNSMTPRSRMLWINQVKRKVTAKELSEITGVGDIDALILKYVSSSASSQSFKD